MARIRSIKPEFPQSESMGRVSRDARLLFVQLWCICDDHGRTRAASRMLASLLFPYDDDAPSLIDGWIGELVREGCVRVYEHDGGHFLEIPNWLKHQKIDHASQSRIPEFREPSRDFASEGETVAPHTLDLGPVPRTKDLGPRTGDQCGAVAPSPLAPAVALFNEMADEHDWPKVQVLSEPRKRALTACLKAVGGIEGWQDLLAKVTASDFLMGRTARSGEHANWRFDFDFLVQPKRYIKIMEGGYGNSPNSQHAPERGLGAALAALAD
mgnify:CR=1 FL=1